MATVEDLYYQLLGRAPDAEGLFHWKNAFGESVDPAEAAAFLNVAQAELANSGYVAAPQAVTNIVAPTTNDSPIASSPAAPTRPSTVNDLYQTFYGTAGDPGGLSYWGGAEKAVSPKDAASWLLWAGKDPSIANKSTGITVDQAYETYLGFKPDETARNYWTGGDPNKALTTAELAAITSEAYGLNPQKGNGIFGSGIGPDVGWVNLRDNLEAAAVVAGNYFLPGSSLLTSQLVTEGAKEALATDVGKIANTAAGAAGGYQGNVSNYGKIGEAAGLTGPTVTPTGAEGGAASGASSSVSAETMQLANATSDPLATLNALQGYTYSDLSYLSSLAGMTPEILAQATANNALLTQIPREVIPDGSSNVTPVDANPTTSLFPGALTIADVIKTIPLVNTVATLVGGGDQPKDMGPTTTGFPVVPVPDTWKPPTYPGNNVGNGGLGGGIVGGAGGGAGGGSFGGLDLNKIFTDQNLLTGTQWQGLPNQRNLTFNDIFAAGQQSTPMGTPVNLNNIVSAILGQNATSQKSA